MKSAMSKGARWQARTHKKRNRRQGKRNKHVKICGRQLKLLPFSIIQSNGFMCTISKPTQHFLCLSFFRLRGSGRFFCVSFPFDGIFSCLAAAEVAAAADTHKKNNYESVKEMSRRMNREREQQHSMSILRRHIVCKTKCFARNSITPD